MVAFARDHSAKDLRGFLDVLVRNYRPDDHDNDAWGRPRKRHARLSASLDGWWHLTGFLDRPPAPRWPQPWTSTRTKPAR